MNCRDKWLILRTLKIMEEHNSFRETNETLLDRQVWRIGANATLQLSSRTKPEQSENEKKQFFQSSLGSYSRSINIAMERKKWTI